LPETVFYNRDAAVDYAHFWAYRRNPIYFDFTKYGGDCTNFVSQCLHAGGARMNFEPIVGWYYKSFYDRTPSWTGPEYLYRFLTTNKGIGPYGWEIPLSEVLPGDVIQMSFIPNIWDHSMIVVDTGINPNPDNVLIATHSADSDYRPISTYNCLAMRVIHINVR